MSNEFRVRVIRSDEARDALEMKRKLARDYTASRSDAKQILTDLEAAQLELLDPEDA
jgi:hypothetical protein